MKISSYCTEIFDLYLNHNKGFKAIDNSKSKGYRTINQNHFSVWREIHFE